MVFRGKSDNSLPLNFRWLAACGVAILASGLFCHPAVSAEDNRSLIFVVDSSENMAPYLSSVKGVILSYTDLSERGDYLGIVLFSNTVKLLTIKKIFGPSDKKSVGIMLDAIDAAGDIADIAGGVARALDEVGKLKRRRDMNVKGVIVISSSKSPKEKQAEETLGRGLATVSKYLGSDEWYIQYCYLNGTRDRQIEALVSAEGGFSYDIDALRSAHDTETIAELYRIISEPEELCAISILDLKGAVLEKKPAVEEWTSLKADANVAEKTHLKVADESRAVLTLGDYGKLGLVPQAKVTLLKARKNPLTGRAVFHLALETGCIWMHFGGKPGATLRVSSAGAVLGLNGESAAVMRSEETGDLRVASFSGSFCVNVIGAAGEPLVLGRVRSTRLRPGWIFDQAEPVEAHLIEEWKCWRKALIGGVPLAVMDFTVPEVVFPENAITLGPIKSGDTESTTFPIRLVGVSDASKLKMTVDISVALPEGLLLFTGIVDGDEPGTKVLSLTVDGREGFRSRRRDTFNGFLKIVPARNSQVVFEKKYIPITIMTKGLVAPPVLVIGAIALVLGACAVGVALAVRTKKSMRPEPHRVIGRLIIIDDPTEGRTGTINLEKISTKSSRLSLVVGRNRTAEVRLKHASVNPDHCTLEAHVVGGRLVTYIEPIGSAKVIVNGKPITSRTPVHDKAKVEIGNFTYQFEDTQLYKRVEVVYRNGRRISGVLDAAGMDAESFRLSPMDAVSPSERARVKFSDIRHVIFHRRTADLLSGAPRSLPKPDTMRRVELMFRKGDTISGYVQREYVEGRRRYITLLPLEPESDIDYTVVDYSAVEDKRDL